MWSTSIVLLTFHIILCYCDEQSSIWRWTCDEGKCKKTRADPKSTEPALSLEACKMFCDEYGLLWPRPTGEVELGNFLSKVNIQNLKVVNTKRGGTDGLIDTAVERFKNQIRQTIPRGVNAKNTGKSVDVYLVNQKPEITAFSLDMNESYVLNVGASSMDKINATIEANSFFGLRHGLETLSQLFVYDDIRDHVLMVRDVTITDSPKYPYRGIMLDTARNFYPVEAIKRTIDAMAAVKLNTFHWHITDSQSFPFVSGRRPNLSKLGAAGPSKTYSMSDMKEVVQHGLERGVRVMPEFDAPAHVGEGWQDTNLTVCFKAEPWRHYCVEPPCGQFNPIREELYQYLEDIYMDMADAFKPDVFHMGGDEVSEACWNSSSEIQQFLQQNIWGLEKQSFLNLWNYFQTKAQEKAYKAFGKGTPLILWTSSLTDKETIDKYLSKDDYIIQVWTAGDSPQVTGLLEKGYRLIISNYDALYLDCGYGAWVGEGNNWCSPYIGWQKIYDNSPAEMAVKHKHLILGGEAALWSEQSDSATLDGRLWPRAAAFAERLWAEPGSSWHAAEHRMLHIRERLVRMGIQAESLQPEWCYQNEGYCY